MKIIPPMKASPTMPLVFIAVFILSGFISGCTSYDPHTGTYEYDSGKTMVAVGTAALAGSVIYHESNRDKYYEHRHYHYKRYRRPPHHYHYHRPPVRRHPHYRYRYR